MCVTSSVEMSDPEVSAVGTRNNFGYHTVFMLSFTTDRRVNSLDFLPVCLSTAVHRLCTQRTVIKRASKGITFFVYCLNVTYVILQAL
jgi:hypothetical protein